MAATGCGSQGRITMAKKSAAKKAGAKKPAKAKIVIKKKKRSGGAHSTGSGQASPAPTKKTTNHKSRTGTSPVPTKAKTKRKPAEVQVPTPQAIQVTGTPTKEPKFVIEGVPPLETGLSAVAALYSALQAMACEIPYDTLSVASGEAFRLYVQVDRARANNPRAEPLAGLSIPANYFATHNILETACEALGLKARLVCLDERPSTAQLKTLWRDIEKSVRAGRPVPACGPQGSFQHEWCLVTGVDEPRDRVFFRDTVHRFELYANGPRDTAWQGWMPGRSGECWMPHLIIEALPKRQVAEERLAEQAIARAIAAAREGFARPNWAAGLAAYAVWILQLGQTDWHRDSFERLREPALANSWLLMNTFAGRRAAGQFFERTSRYFAGKKNAAMHRAARFYSAAAGALQTAGALFPNWGQQYEEPDRRAKAAELLAMAASAEGDAAAALEEAFGE
jgi:hypothetical protein